MGQSLLLIQRCASAGWHRAHLRTALAGLWSWLLLGAFLFGIFLAGGLLFFLFGRQVRVVFLHNAIGDLLLLRILYGSAAVVRDGVGMLLIEFNPPLEEQLQLDTHGMDTGFHDYKLALG